jgi:hypothetical protein
MSEKKSITTRIHGEQTLTEAERAKLAMLHTGYQQAFLSEGALRIECNKSIAKLRQAERELKSAAMAVVDFRQRMLLDVPRIGTKFL